MQLRRTVDPRKILRLDALTFGDDSPVDVLDPRAVWWTYGDLAYCGARPTNEPGLAYMIRSGVVDSAKGQGLQRRMIRVRMRWARSEGYTGVCTYTVIENAASANNLIACGFRLYNPSTRWAGDEILYWYRDL